MSNLDRHHGVELDGAKIFDKILMEMSTEGAENYLRSQYRNNNIDWLKLSCKKLNYII